MSARETVLDYYEALRRGEPLEPYFAERSDTVESGDLRVTTSPADDASWVTDQGPA